MFRRRFRAPESPRGASTRQADGAHPFTVVRNGYAMPEVAAFVSRVSVDLGSLTPQELRKVSFGVARRGYDKAEVVAYLNGLAAEVEAEVAQARELARHDRIVGRAGIDAPLPQREPPAPPVDPAPVVHAHPSPPPAPETPPATEPTFETTWAAPAPAPGPEPDPTPPVTYWSEQDQQDLASVVWLDEEPGAAPVPAPEPRAPQPPTQPSVAPTLQSDPEPPEPEPQAHQGPQTAPTAVDASAEIAALLRAAHDNAIRLKEQAEADVRHTVETARRQVDEQRRQQEQELQAAREAVERDHAAARHAAELEATAIRQRAEQDAATARAAAAAVLAQAKAEIEAVQALARHNMSEIEAVKQTTIEQARELLSLGKGMIATVIDLDRDAADRLDASRRRTLDILGEIAS